MSRPGNCCDNSQWNDFLEVWKMEWVPTKGYQTFNETRTSITGYYSQVRPHQYNGGLAPNESEKRY